VSYLKQKLFHDEPDPCSTEGCDGLVWSVNSGVCKDCSARLFEAFKVAMRWST
jgi:hypothetical protein